MDRILRRRVHKLRFWRGCDAFGVDFGQRRRGRITVEIGDGIRGFRGRRRRQLVHDRAGQTFFATAPAAPATTSATAWPPLAACRLIGANRAGLLFGFILVGFVFVGDDAGNRDRG